MKNSDSLDQSPKTPNKKMQKTRRAVGVATTLAVLAVAGESLLGSGDDDSITSTHATTTEAGSSTTALGAGDKQTKPYGELDPRVEEKKQQIGDDLIKTFEQVFNGENNAKNNMQIERGSIDPSYEGGPRNYIANVTIDGKIVRLTMTAPGEKLSPDFSHASYVTAEVVIPNGGEVTSDNPTGELYGAQLTWQRTFIEGMEGRVDISGSVGNTTAPFSSQTDMGYTPNASFDDAIVGASQALTMIHHALNVG